MDKKLDYNHQNPSGLVVLLLIGSFSCLNFLGYLKKKFLVDVVKWRQNEDLSLGPVDLLTRKMRIINKQRAISRDTFVLPPYLWCRKWQQWLLPPTESWTELNKRRRFCWTSPEKAEQSKVNWAIKKYIYILPCKPILQSLSLLID